jgi:hypothetical protein
MSGTAQLVSSEEKENRKARQSPYMFAMADRLNCSASHAILAFNTVDDYFSAKKSCLSLTTNQHKLNFSETKRVLMDDDIEPTGASPAVAVVMVPPP